MHHPGGPLRPARSRGDPAVPEPRAMNPSETETSELASLTVTELRELRIELAEAEAAYSYAVCMTQGRLELLQEELEHRSGEQPANTSPVPTDAASGWPSHRGHEFPPPAWADELLSDTHVTLPAGRLARLGELDLDELTSAASEMNETQRRLAVDHSLAATRLREVRTELVQRFRRGEGIAELRV